jgi:hypothetical protein
MSLTTLDLVQNKEGQALKAYGKAPTRKAEQPLTLISRQVAQGIRRARNYLLDDTAIGGE